MKITTKGLGKKFGREWIFKDLNYEFKTGQPTAIIGPNGSGKSTLLQILTGAHLPSKGDVTYEREGQIIKAEDVFQYMDISAPYLELIEEFTLDEMIQFHFQFKTLKDGINPKKFKELIYMEDQGNKQIKQFSSGMKQRLKLGLCFFSASPITFLDEPTSNLDATGISWYQKNIKDMLNNKTLIISSNQFYEYDFCQNILDIATFK